MTTPACASYPQLDWHSSDPAEQEDCAAICRRCPLREACLAGALERDEPAGVWGGETFPRPPGMLLDPPPPAADVHGSNARYAAHGCRCGPCRAAHARSVAEWRTVPRAERRPVAEQLSLELA